MQGVEDKKGITKAEQFAFASRVEAVQAVHEAIRKRIREDRRYWLTAPRK